jgi:hypothetical protein
MSSILNDIGFPQTTEDGEYFASDVALQAADDFRFGLSLLGAPFKVCSGSLVVSEPDNHYSMDSSVCSAVATTIEAVAISFARRSRYGTHPT